MLFVLLISLLGCKPLMAASLNNSREISVNGPGRYRLLKLVDVEFDRRFDNIVKDIESDIFPQVESDIAPPLESNFGDTNENCVDQTNSGCKECRQILTVLEELKSDVKHLKEHDMRTNDFGGICYPVGVSKYRFCQRGHPLNEGPKSNQTIPRSCKEVLDRGNNISGVYQIQPVTTDKPLLVLCDMETRGGGWTHIQKRVDGSEDFFLGWREYKHGFGDLAGEFWIGLENIHKMTASSSSELLVELVDGNNKSEYVHYTTFKIASEDEGYQLEKLGGYSGNLYDALNYHVGSKFTTKDFDQDKEEDNKNCAILYTSGWWFKNCFRCSLNGKYTNIHLPANMTYAGITWQSPMDVVNRYTKSRMLLRNGD